MIIIMIIIIIIINAQQIIPTVEDTLRMTFQYRIHGQFILQLFTRKYWEPAKSTSKPKLLV